VWARRKPSHSVAQHFNTALKPPGSSRNSAPPAALTEPDMPVLEPEALINERVAAIRDMHQTAGQKRAEVDVSGGVDSGVILPLVARAVGPENVTAVHLAIHSNPDALVRAREVCDASGVRLIEFDGTAIFEALLSTMTDAMVKAGFTKAEILARCETDKSVLGSIRSTSRAPWGRAANRLSGGGLRHGTGNEDEDRIMRFFQKGGDGEVDSNPIAFLSKGEVYQLAIALGVPRSVLDARPSPDLWGVGDAHNDEEEIASYLGLSGCGIPFYSYVDVDTRKYRNVGLIERVSRACDDTPNIGWMMDGYGKTWGEVLFSDLARLDVKAAIEQMSEQPQFKGIPTDVTRTLLTNARKVERVTRHKMNPNCPMLGDRERLLNAVPAILTNELPV